MMFCGIQEDDSQVAPIIYHLIWGAEFCFLFSHILPFITLSVDFALVVQRHEILDRTIVRPLVLRREITRRKLAHAAMIRYARTTVTLLRTGIRAVAFLRVLLFHLAVHRKPPFSCCAVRKQKPICLNISPPLPVKFETTPILRNPLQIPVFPNREPTRDVRPRRQIHPNRPETYRYTSFRSIIKKPLPERRIIIRRRAGLGEGGVGHKPSLHAISIRMRNQISTQRIRLTIFTPDIILLLN